MAAKERTLVPPSWLDWCINCQTYRPHGYVAVDTEIRGGYCGHCGQQHSMKLHNP